MLNWEDIPLFQPAISPTSYTLTADNIKGFAGEWDPFPPHVDEAAAASSPVGSLFAAGVHLLSITIRLGHSILSEETADIASRGWDALRFHRPERGVLVSRFELFNQKGDTVVSFDSQMVMLRRAAEKAA